ncbi:hypothetical protein FA95DRAFT_1529800 [Auriscalpium vulgare]|uniref:Uncharacterized protein n=1 Tax=Auriscalpium vulgare TaxID=40419 RepID=A0ACB8SDI0_9AGAM|nr:hypothetical protein FA95DRAFT_1529800 [Auriscalpium vulgare]
MKHAHSTQPDPQTEKPRAPSEPRKEKRKKRREAEPREDNADREENAEAGPGPSTLASKTKKRNKGSKSGTATPLAGPGAQSAPPAPTFDQNTDFIPFDFADEPDEAEEPARPGDADALERRRENGKADRRERDGDSGKGKARVREPEPERDRGGDRGRKRKSGEYDRDDGYDNKKQRLDAASRKAPWVANVDWESSANVAELLHRETEAFVQYVSPTQEEDEIRALIVDMISQAVSKNFPDAKVHPFGSFETKLYLPLGDIDLVVLSKSMEYSDRVTVLHALANTVKRAGITDKVTIIAKAKVPIIKFITTHGRFAVDISINQANGVEAGKMVKGFLAEMPALRTLVMVTKAFLSQRSMNEVFSGGLGSYSIVCLAVSFLQMHPKIRRGEIDPMRNLGVLVMEFFELYGLYFNYQEVGISLRDGGTYYSKTARGWSDYQKSSLLSIEDPGDPSNDVSRGSYNIARVRQTFAGAHGIMTAAAYMQAGVLHSRRSGRSVNLRGYTDPADMSILSSVLGVTQETLNRRRLVQELYDKRVLHRFLGVPQKDSETRTRAGKAVGKNAPINVSAMKSVIELEDDSDLERPAKKNSNSRQHEVIDVDSGDEEESRYTIPPKRRRTGDASDARTVYTTDDDDDYASDRDVILHTLDNLTGYDDDEAEVEGRSSGSEAGEVKETAKPGEKLKNGGPVKIDRKRAFWAAKGGRSRTPQSD